MKFEYIFNNLTLFHMFLFVAKCHIRAVFFLAFVHTLKR